MAGAGERAPLSYILPLRSNESAAGTELAEYVRWLSTRCETIVVDGSPAHVYSANAAAWGAGVIHVPPSPSFVTPMGKVGGVLTGVDLASHEHLIIGDDDVRYDADALDAMNRHLDAADVVRPQNYFSPLPWHACWDTGRTLLNRTSGGDWPGTLGVRRSVLLRTGGYDGAAMFENLELVRTVRAAGGTERVPLDVYVARRPSSSRHFFSQRIRQAYDELARPTRLVMQLAVLPLSVLIAYQAGWRGLLAFAVAVAALAEVGRRRAGGTQYFPFRASLCAPAWLAERAICSWLAVGARVTLGGVPYRGRILSHAATPMSVLLARFSNLRPLQPTEAPRRSA
ncbi:MAG: glycosyltransferase family 2 protein [Gemmatimonadota bacterium]|nr:glycosyltransferase family 2 protein [Gemmatimonadota bacterium]